MLRRCWLVLIALCAAAAAPPSVDSVHGLMERAHPRPRAPRLRNPAGAAASAAGRAGVLTLVGRAVTPRRALAVLPAALIGMAIACPDLLAQLLLQVVCFVGSLFEPYETFLPEGSLLLSFAKSVKAMKKAYAVKHGLPSIDDQHFFDDDDDDEDEALAAASDALAAAEAADDGGSSGDGSSSSSDDVDDDAGDDDDDDDDEEEEEEEA